MKGRVFATKDFDKYRRKVGWSDSLLIATVREIESGLFDADLGSGLFKRRVARPGSGRSSGYRVVVALKINERAFLVDAFSKNDKSNHTPSEMRALKMLASYFLGLTEEELSIALEAKVIVELEKDENINE